MNQIRSEEYLARMLSGKGAALFVFVDWSEYARRGLVAFKEAEAKLTEKSTDGSISLWLADISSTDSPLSSALHRWLTSQEQRGAVHMFPSIAVGNGSVVWMKSGEVVGFHAIAERLGADGLAHRTEEMLADS